jgi:hypothetical protein
MNPKTAYWVGYMEGYEAAWSARLKRWHVSVWTERTALILLCIGAGLLLASAFGGSL